MTYELGPLAQRLDLAAHGKAVEGFASISRTRGSFRPKRRATSLIVSGSSSSMP